MTATAISFPTYDNTPLEELAEKLHTDYYKLIRILSTQIKERCEYLRAREMPQSSYTYLSHCDDLTNEVKKYLDYRFDVLTDYVKELANKSATGHDCGNCSGKCDVHHSAKLFEFLGTIQDVKEILKRIRTTVVLRYRITHTELEVVYNEITLLDNILHELFLIEEASLLPKIKLAQKTINVVS